MERLLYSTAAEVKDRPFVGVVAGRREQGVKGLGWTLKKWSIHEGLTLLASIEV